MYVYVVGCKMFCNCDYKIVMRAIVFLNQASAGLQPARAWFPKIAFVREVSMCVWMCVCMSAPEAMNN